MDLAELSIAYNKSPVVHQSGCLKNLKAGAYLPAFELLDNSSQQMISSITLTQDTSHHLFLFSGQKPKKIPGLLTQANQLAEQFAQSIKVHLILTNRDEAIKGAFNTLVDTQKVQQKLGIKKPTLVLIRPDKYIGFIQNPVNIEQFIKTIYLTT